MPTIIDGTTGVDKVQAGAIEASDIPDASLPVAKLSATGTANNTTFLRGDGSWQTISTSPTTDQVLSATAGASVGAVGTYALARNNTASTITYGSTVAGSNLRRSSGQFDPTTGVVAFISDNNAYAGTWRNMSRDALPSINGGTSLFLRIS